MACSWLSITWKKNFSSTQTEAAFRYRNICQVYWPSSNSSLVIKHMKTMLKNKGVNHVKASPLMRNCQTGVLPFLYTQDMKRGSNFSCISNLRALKRPNCLNWTVRHVFHTLASWIISNLHWSLKNKCALPEQSMQQNAVGLFPLSILVVSVLLRISVTSNISNIHRWMIHSTEHLNCTEIPEPENI